MQKREKILSSELTRILEVLIREYSPIKVVLFGSMSEGKITEWSDIDLAIIKASNSRFLDRISEVLLLVRPKVACDVVVYTPSEFDQMIKDGNYFAIEEIQKKGKVLYERSQ